MSQSTSIGFKLAKALVSEVRDDPKFKNMEIGRILHGAMGALVESHCEERILAGVSSDDVKSSLHELVDHVVSEVEVKILGFILNMNETVIIFDEDGETKWN